MSRTSFKDWKRAVTAPFAKRWGLTGDDTKYDNAWSNGYTLNGATATDNEDLPLIGTDSDNAVLVNGEAIKGMTTSETFYLNSLTGTPNQTILMAMFPMRILSIQCEFATANGAALTAQITKESTPQAVAAGSPVMSNSFNLNATANTVQAATLADYLSPGAPAATATTNPTRDRINLNANDRLSIKFSGAVTSLAGLAITVHYIPGAKGHVAYYRMSANASIATQFFFLANRQQTVRAVSMFWGTKATDAGAVTIDVTKDVSTNAPGAGTSILTAAQSVKGAANTPVSVGLAASAATLLMAAGNRLAIKTTGTLTALADVVVAVWFQSVPKRKEVTFNLLANGSQATQPFFVADSDYELDDLSEVHDTAGTDGSAVNIAVTIEAGTTAPGSGLVSQTDNTNAGFDAKATANTVQVGTLATLRNRIVPAGGRISVKYAGTLTTLKGVVVAVSLRPLG